MEAELEAQTAMLQKTGEGVALDGMPVKEKLEALEAKLDQKPVEAKSGD
jgi:hypothetical protein